MPKKTNNFRWIVVKDAYWKYTNGIFSTPWNDAEYMSQSFVDKLLGITPQMMLRCGLKVKTRDELKCAECGAMGWHFDTDKESAPHYCPNCGTQMIFDDER